MVSPHNFAPSIHKALNFYHARLTEKFHGRLVTTSLLYVLNEELQSIQRTQLSSETHPIWKYAVKVIANPLNPGEFLVVEAN